MDGISSVISLTLEIIFFPKLSSEHECLLFIYFADLIVLEASLEFLTILSFLLVLRDEELK